MFNDLEEDILLTVGRNIKMRRENIGYTRKQLAHFISISDRTMQKYEDGQSYLNIAQIFYILHALKMDMNALYHMVDNQDLPNLIDQHFNQN